jgi:hypothetical protein
MVAVADAKDICEPSKEHVMLWILSSQIGDVVFNITPEVASQTWIIDTVHDTIFVPVGT